MGKRLLKIGKKEDGLTGIDIVIGMGLIVIFIPLITTMFVNIYMNWMTTKRSAMASSYGTQIIEKIEAMYYDDIPNGTTTPNGETDIDIMINQMKTDFQIPEGYKISSTIQQYTKQNETTEDLIKKIAVTIEYKVKKQTESLVFNTIKSKEILITPNVPKLGTDMIPVKKVGNNSFEIVYSNDNSWYSYENRKYAYAMSKTGAVIEGISNIADVDNDSLVGKRIITPGSIYVWIPRFAYKTENGNVQIKFLYSNTEKYVESNEPYSIDGTSYQVPEAFSDNGTEITGFWVRVNGNIAVWPNDYDAEKLGNEEDAVNILSHSQYGSSVSAGVSG